MTRPGRFAKMIGIISILVISGLILTTSASTVVAKTGPDIKTIISTVEDNLQPLVIIVNREKHGFSLENRMKHYGVPGVSIAVIYDGELAWANGYGLADIESGIAVDTATLFRAASISKPVTAAAALRLVDMGVLHLDTPVNDQLHTWSIPDNEYTAKRAITLRQLLSHSAGLSDDPDLSYRQDQPVPTLIQILAGLEPSKTPAARVDTLPGAVAHYSNQGYCIVQLLMTEVTKKPFPSLMKELVLEPANMTHSTFEQFLSANKASETAIGYLASGEELPGGRLICPAMAPAGLWSTPSDLARFALAIINSRSNSNDALLSGQLTAEMLTIQAGEYGLGFSLEDSGDAFCFSHGGASDGFRCFMIAFPNRGQGAVIMTNSDAGQGLYLEIIRGLASIFDWPSYLPIEKKIEPMTENQLVKFEGNYLLNGRVELKFNAEEDHLRMNSPANVYRLFPENERTFFEIDYGFTIEFEVNDSSMPEAAILNRGGVIDKLARVR